MSVEIGSTLRDTRRRQGLDVREVELRTKIRARYIRALENEDWQALPAPAYVRGFLRTYGEMLGIDGELLADEFRRRHEAHLTPEASTGTDSVLTERRRHAPVGPPRGPIIGGIAAVLVVLVLIIGLGGGGDDDAPPIEPRQERQAGNDKNNNKSSSKKNQKQGSKKSAKKLEKVPLRLRAQSLVEICLVAGDAKRPLIDSQLLDSGSDERHDGSKRYRLDINGGGSVLLTVGDREKSFETDDSMTIEADSRGIREASYQGPDCP